MGLLGLMMVGLFDGWLAGSIMKAGGPGLCGNLLPGMIGAVLGGIYAICSAFMPVVYRAPWSRRPPAPC